MEYTIYLCSDEGTAATEDLFERKWAEAVEAGDRALELAERAAWIYENWIRFLGKLGAVVGTAVKYWPAAAGAPCRSQVLSRRPLVVLAGYMSQHRGLAWDRRSRRGQK